MLCSLSRRRAEQGHEEIEGEVVNRQGILAVFATAAVAVGLAIGLQMPVANADALPNGLTVDCSQDSDIHATCIVGGCPRVNGDYVVDAVHVTVAGQITQNESQHEYEFKCINGQTARQGVGTTPGGTARISVQGCRKKDLESDWCGPWSEYAYTAPAKPAAPAAPPPAPAPAPAPAAPQTKQCPDGGPVVPVADACPVKKVAPTNAVTLSVKKAGLQANVTVGNTSDISADCTYDATEANGLGPAVHRDFSLAAKGSTTLNFPAPLIGQSYQIVAACNANFEGQTVEIGRATGNA
jgi:pyruvate/2-oxoglutarate dehydrogenase complex dihydrolipoamide acyltransferase (E2) component